MRNLHIEDFVVWTPPVPSERCQLSPNSLYRFPAALAGVLLQNVDLPFEMRSSSLASPPSGLWRAWIPVSPACRPGLLHTVAPRLQKQCNVKTRERGSFRGPLLKRRLGLQGCDQPQTNTVHLSASLALLHGPFLGKVSILVIAAKL